MMAFTYLYFGCMLTGPIIWLSWMDDCIIAGNKGGFKAAKEQMKQWFGSDDVDKLTQFICCKFYELY